MDEYSREFKELLKNRLEVPDKKDKEEVTGLLLGHGTDKEEVQNLLETCMLHLSDDGRNFLQQYSQTIEENLEWAKNLDSTQSVLSKENEYRMLLSLAEQLVDELETAVGEENELESIARKLEDAHLLAEVDYEKEQTQKMSEKLSGLLKRREKLQALLEEIENLNEFVESHEILQALKHRQNVIEIMLEKSTKSPESSPEDTSDGIKVLISEEDHRKLKELALNYVEEVAGSLLCRKDGNRWIGLKIIMSGSGSEENVSVDSNVSEAVKDLVSNYSKYRFVDFHTHSIGTIHEYGPKYAKGWSDWDKRNIKNAGEGYIGMLITPETTLVSGNGVKTSLNKYSKSGFSNFKEWEEKLDEDWKNIVDSNGYDVSVDLDLTEFKGGK